ncbi:MAG TPA: SulP family inorganic anion transporter [Anaerolineales bacterium]
MQTPTGRVLNRSFLSTLGTSLFTAFFIFLLEIIFVVAFTALIFSGELSSQVPRALGFMILGDAVLCGVVALLSSNPAAIALEQDAPGAMMSAIAAGIIAALAGAVSRQFATVLMMVVVTALLTGLILLALGFFKLGGWARFLPYPVIGGFLGGTGWLLVQGGIAMMANQPMGASWFQAAALKLWVPGIVLGAVIYFGVRRVNTPYTIPGIMLGATALFYAIAWAMKLTAADLRLTGWLMEQYSSAETWQFPFSPALLSQVDWMVLLKSIPALLPVALISVIGLLLNSSGMELIIKRDIDLNRELVSAGIGNLAAGLAGGLVGFPDISFSALNHMTGARRLVGVLAAMFLAATLVVGTSTVLFIPKFVFGSVLIYLGLELLGEWVVKAWSKFSRLDFTIIIVILLTLALRGVLEGVIVGLILAVLSFVVSYSRVSVIKFAFSGREYRSRVTRSPGEQGILDTHGDELYVLRLEGFIFFGTANGIFQRLRERVGTPGAEIRYCLFDFSKVTGIDSTGMLSFSRMLQWCQEQGISLALAGLPGPTREEFLRENASLPEEALHFFADADHGIEWCEGQIIAAHPTEHSTQRSIQEQLRDILGQDGVEKLTGHMACHEYHAGEYLIREGDAPDLIYFVESGRVTAQLETPGKNPVRLETINHGRIVGEIAFFLGRTRTASVVADEDSVVWSLSMQDLELMQSEDPEAANLFHRLSVILLSQRVMHLTQTVRALERS